MLDGRWSDPRVLLVPPYSKTVPSPGSEVLGFTTGFDCRLEVLLSRYRHSGTAAVCTRSGLGLGIDTGGTFTDAVIYDFEAGEVRAQAKHPTNHADLTSGIRGALAGLPAELLRGVRRVGLSTTLATNAFVERKGRKVALLVMSPIAVPLDALPFSYVRQLRGAMTIEGQETAPVDDAEIAAESVRARAAGCEAIAVSGFGGVINSAHEARVARIAFETTGLPAVCGHQLTSQLNFIERATTAAMNAKLVPLIEALLDAVRATLSDCGLDGVAVFVVKGDGSQMLDRVARETPVETVLSGPAASVIGALRLTGLQHAVIADMGGTTLDLALVRDGAPQLRNSGARIAGFQTSVRAMAVHTVGLGGDSEIDLSRWPTVRIGPRRIVHMCRMREDCPDAHERIAAVSRQLVSLERNSLDWIGLAPGVAPDSGLLTQLRDGPLSLQELAYRLLRPAPEYLDWQEYEDRGRIRRYGLTLTDILHVTGAYVAFDRDAAHQLLTLWATLLETDQESLVDGIYTEFRRVLCCEVLDVALPEACPWERDEDFVRWLTGHFASGQPAGQVQFGVKLAVPLVGVGAPAPVLFPQVKAILQTEICLPEHAGVANAVGAIAGDVRLQETAEVRVGEDQSLLCRWRGGLQRATNLEGALRLCEAQLTELLRQEAAANDVPFSTPEFAASVQEAETRDGTLFLGLSLTGCLRG